MGPVLRARRRARRAVTVAFVVGVGATVGCGPSEPEVQQLPPEIVDLAAVYDAPTGTVPAFAQTQIAELQQELETIRESDIVRLVSSALVNLHDRVQEGGLATDPTIQPKEDWPRIDGSVTITRICRGWDPAVTTPDPANGTIQVIAQFNGSVLQRTVLGTFSSCRDRIDGPGGTGVNVFLNGTLAIYLQGPLPAAAVDASFLLGWSGTLGTEAAQANATFDFRVVPPQLEVRIPVADGDIIGSVGGNGVTFRGANGTFACSAETFDCAPI